MASIGSQNSIPELPDGFRWIDQDLILTVHAVPGAKRSEAVGFHGDAIRIRIAAGANDGKANKELREYLARLLQVPVSKVEIEAGQKSRRKRVRIVSAEKVKLSELLARIRR